MQKIPWIMHAKPCVYSMEYNHDGNMFRVAGLLCVCVGVCGCGCGCGGGGGGCFSFICVWNNSFVNNADAGDLRRHRTHYDVTVMVNLMANTVCILWYIYGLVQDCSNSSALAMEWLQSCTKPSIYDLPLSLNSIHQLTQLHDVISCQL